MVFGVSAWGKVWGLGSRATSYSASAQALTNLLAMESWWYTAEEVQLIPHRCRDQAMMTRQSALAGA